ncbi:dihydrofolate-thymadylate synthase-like protein [Salicola phage SCTP-2]|nr:dihydrofolate-thymadylate synthase-like protein [Salicola phage SCTP-2]
MFNQQYHNESGYVNLLNNIYNHGVDTEDRTGFGCRKLFNQQLIFNCSEYFPSASVRPTPLRFAFEEFWMFLNGVTDTNHLINRGIKIWEGNTSREFLDNRGLYDEPTGSMGKAYGYQLRNFNGEHIDQLLDTVEQLRNNPFSRRHYVTFWNPAQSHEMALLPCFHSHQFVVTKNDEGSKVLNLKVFSRSSDAVFGLPFNYQQYALYLLAMAELVNMDVGHLAIDLTDAHIYTNQIEYTEEILTREYYENETGVKLNKSLNTIDDLLYMKWEDVLYNGRVNKTPMKTPKPQVAV